MDVFLHVSRVGKRQDPSGKIYLILSVLLFSCLPEVNCSDCTGSDDILKPLKPLEGKKSDVTLYDEKGAIKTQFKVGICCSLGTTNDSSVQLQDGFVTFGTYKMTSVSEGTNFIQLSYNSDSYTFSGKCNKTVTSTKILFICDPKTDYGTMQVLEKFHEQYLCSYTFEVGTRYACVSKEGLSSGSIFCILFFTGVSIYLLLGFLYQRLLVGAKGLEQIPNYSFWRDFGNLQADGCDFICRCGPRQEAQSYRGIDERIPRDDERDDQLLNM